MAEKTVFCPACNQPEFTIMDKLRTFSKGRKCPGCGVVLKVEGGLYFFFQVLLHIAGFFSLVALLLFRTPETLFIVLFITALDLMNKALVGQLVLKDRVQPRD